MDKETTNGKIFFIINSLFTANLQLLCDSAIIAAYFRSDLKFVLGTANRIERTCALIMGSSVMSSSHCLAASSFSTFLSGGGEIITVCSFFAFQSRCPHRVRCIYFLWRWKFLYSSRRPFFFPVSRESDFRSLCVKTWHMW